MVSGSEFGPRRDRFICSDRPLEMPPVESSQSAKCANLVFEGKRGGLADT
jgi:hypothetical protein